MSSNATASPQPVLSELVRANESRAGRLARQGMRLSVARGVSLVLLIGIGLAGTETTWLAPVWIGIPAAIFLGLVLVHHRVASAERLARRRSAFYGRALARVEGRWVGQGATGDQFKQPDHPYAEDLDVFGHGSLFELLCTARTGSGEATLAQWLLQPAPPGVIARRQTAVTELRPQLELRERLAMVGRDDARAPSLAGLERWAAAPPEALGAGRQLVAVLLTAGAACTLTGWTALGWSAAPAVAATVAVGIFGRLHHAWARRVVGAMRQPARSLGLVSELLELIERTEVAAEELRAIRSDLRVAGLPASAQIARLRRLGVLIDSGYHMIFAPFASLMLWQLHLAAAVERWRLACGPQLAGWFAALGRFEALSSIAGYSWEHPDDPFPEIADGGPRFAAEALAHPMLPRHEAVANDLELSTEPAALIVSGSNMSGKSTLLRAVGVNAVLAQAGAPVCARRLAMSPLAVGASIATHDSLLEGRSRFFAEISRMKQITELSRGADPALFLLDEVFHGTNSHDRRIGAEQLMRFLVEQGAIGLMTTHDLALAAIAEQLAPRAANVHFRDRLGEEGIVFDYRLHPGTVTRSNALALMRQVGLPVFESD